MGPRSPECVRRSASGRNFHPHPPLPLVSHTRELSGILPQSGSRKSVAEAVYILQNSGAFGVLRYTSSLECTLIAA